MKKSSKIIAIVVAIIIIAASAVLAVQYYMKAQPPLLEDISIKKVTKTYTGLQVDVMTIPPEFSGIGTLNIKNEASENEVAYTEPIEIKNGYATVTIPYKSFVTDNGNYTVEILFLGKTDTEIIELIGVVEEITIVNVYAVLDGTQPKIYIGIWTKPSVPLAASCNVTITNLDTNTPIYANIPYKNQTQIFEDSLTYERSGEYKIEVMVVNNLKVQTSVKKTIFKEGNESINLKPVIKEYPRDTKIYNTHLDNGTRIPAAQAYESDGWARFVRKDSAGNKSYEVTYDVVDYDDMLSSLTVIWDVGYNKTQEKPVASPSEENGTNDTVGGIGAFDVWYQYPAKPASYKVYLSISDRYASDSATCEITVITGL